jgi:hypothetical protein
MATVFANSTLTLSNATLTPVPFDSELFDNFSMHDPADNTKLTIKVAGKYIFFTTLEFAPNSTGIRQVKFLHNSGASYGLHSMVANTGGNYTRFAISCPIREYTVNEWMKIEVYQDSTGNLDVPHNVGVRATFSAIWCGA